MKFTSTLILMALCALLLFTCKEDDNPNPKNACSVEDPVHDLPWLAAKVEEMQNSSLAEYWYVTQAQYGTETVFIYGNCCPFCNTMTPVFNCSGEQLGIVGDGTFEMDSFKDEAVIWAPDDSHCQF